MCSSKFEILPRSSFDDVDVWFENLGRPRFCVIVATKIDKHTRAVSTEEGKRKARRLRCLYLETSAKDDHASCWNVIETLTHLSRSKEAYSLGYEKPPNSKTHEKKKNCLLM